MEERIRLADIAEELGVSTATVSNVLHGKTDRVSEETFRRVQAALEERQYFPSMAGILLARNDSRMIGVVINDHEKYERETLADGYISAALSSLSTEIEKSGRFVLVKKTTEPDEIIRFASMWNLDGLVLMGFCDADYAYLRARMHIPFVVYDGYCDGLDGVYNITINNFSGGYQVGAHFCSLGHRRALCVADNHICCDHARWRGFRAGFGGGAVFWEVPMQRAARREFYLSNWEALRSFSAVFAVSDGYAAELLALLAEKHVSVPEEMAVAGFDDAPICTMLVPALTSVRQDTAKRAELAVSYLAALREGRTSGKTTMLPVRLIPRGSTIVNASKTR